MRETIVNAIPVAEAGSAIGSDVTGVGLQVTTTNRLGNAVRHTATSVWHTGPTWEVTNIAANTVTARTAAAVIATFATRAVGNATAILQTILSGVQHAIATNRDRRSEYYAGAVTRVTVIEIAVITLLARVVNPVATNRKHAIPTTSR